ncbi:hypothetical protein B5G12_01620 [Faecalibacterium sp. An58]|uniref:phage tail assembly protein n=1 Tax=Faecalibacterium sp. An58 TaxID=1965648 RepID=UPI000B373837|nr:phage tail assembly protein [Faecalibacterium sp. An58]OUN75796.1 hypothetical protein B5G12_01620 [Faecalibacterium sp. An58]
MNAHIADPNVLDARKPEDAPAADPNTEDQEDLILRFKKPYSFEGETYTEVDLSGLEDLSAADLCKVGKMVKKIDGVDPIAEMSLPYAIFMAARVTGKPLEFFQQLPAREAIKLKNLVAGFLYGGDGEE